MHLNKSVRVRFQGGREVIGILRGFDPLVNCVLDDAVELMRDPADPENTTSITRKLGLVMCRGTTVTVVGPNDGYAETENPFAVEDYDAEPPMADAAGPGPEEDAPAE